MYTKPKRVTMRDRASDEDLPRFVRGNNATPDRLGNADDVAWSIAEELERFFYEEGIVTGKNSAWFFKRGQAALDKSKLRVSYSEHPERFRDGNGRALMLAEFGRNMVRYFRKNAAWAYCSNADDVIGMFYDPVTLDNCAKGLWRAYRDRRKKRGIALWQR